MSQFFSNCLGISSSNATDSLQSFTEIVDLQHQNGNRSQSPVKSRAPKRSAEEMLKWKQEREENQRVREAQRMGRVEEKAQKRAMVEAAKALRPEECIKYMVAVVDPGKVHCSLGPCVVSVSSNGSD